ncbi:pyroglutamyl-peptidase I [Rothia sp. CCM 9419]|uniref:pyroglutamyl-peptidase I family protein n=1 Tax=Rothia sp. CCM 9419 TaxID=3402662 RepID=UPI003AE9B9FA
MKILLTYFGAFPGVPVNPTQQVAQALQQRYKYRPSIESIEYVIRELPVSFARSSQELVRILRQEHPDIAISLGVAVGRSRISIEHVAINYDEARIPDNDGEQRRHQLIHAEGETAYFARLPIPFLSARMQELSLPVEVSYSAGTYVCNHVMYELLHHYAHTPDIYAGFIHIPALAVAESQNFSASADAGGVEGTIPTLEESTVVDTLDVIVSELVQHRETTL